MKTLTDYDIIPTKPGRHKTRCPKCSDTRKKKHMKDLDLNPEEGIWKCWHCGWAGSLKTGEEYVNTPKSAKVERKTYSKPLLSIPQSQDKEISLLKGRGIPQEVVDLFKVAYFDSVFFPQPGQKKKSIGFPYFKNGNHINTKYRSKDKDFAMEKDCERTFYNYDEINSVCTIICEGEIDVMSFYAAGAVGAISVPNGAPPPEAKNVDSHLQYFEDSPELEKVEEFIIATDGDEPGEALAEHIVKRLGAHRCLRVQYPEDCKDANEVLMKHGEEGVQKLIQNAKRYEIEGLFLIDQVICKDSDLITSQQPGLSTGYRGLDRLYTVNPGEWTVITGLPGDGKSEFLDQIVVNLAKLHDWKIAIFSPENQPLATHVSKLLEKYANLPIKTQAQIDNPRVRMALDEMNRRFFPINPRKDSSLDNILSIAQQAVFRHGINGLIIDPWNELEHFREKQFSETEYISVCLQKLRQFARDNRVHIWVVAHPFKLQKRMNIKKKPEKKDENYDFAEYQDYPVATPYDIAGSANWFNKCDNAITVYRIRDEEFPHIQVHVKKVRFKANGRPGKVDMEYDELTGTYKEI